MGAHWCLAVGCGDTRALVEDKAGKALVADAVDQEGAVVTRRHARKRVVKHEPRGAEDAAVKVVGDKAVGCVCADAVAGRCGGCAGEARPVVGTRRAHVRERDARPALKARRLAARATPKEPLVETRRRNALPD